jgi:GNAT superfamily N-acetyltransferase
MQFDEHAIDTPPARLRGAIAAVLSNPDLGFFLLAREGGRAIGVAYVSFVWALEHCGRGAWLEELYVFPSERGRGVGEELLHSALAKVRERGVAAVDLEVEHSRQRAENLYRRAGFEPLTRARWVRHLSEVRP